jgi:hypothetical protein
MSNGDSKRYEGRVLDAYRAASTALDEQPQPGTRAAVLAAAARAVQAQPQDAATGRTAARRALHAPERVHVSRRPLALVASVLVGAVALLLAIQTDDGQLQAPQEAAAPASAPPLAMQSGPPSRAEPAPAVAPAPAGAPAQLPVPAPAPMVAAPPVPAKVIAPPPSPAQVPLLPRAPQVAAGRVESREAAAVRPFAPAVPDPPRALADAPVAERDARAASAPPPPEVRSRSTLGAASAGVTATAPLADQERSETGQTLTLRQRAMRADSPRAKAGAADAPAEDHVIARPVQRTAPMADGALEDDPARWMARIVELRAAGKDAEADEALKRLRARYPDYVVPEAALRRAGTR